MLGKTALARLLATQAKLTFQDFLFTNAMLEDKHLIKRMIIKEHEDNYGVLSFAVIDDVMVAFEHEVRYSTMGGDLSSYVPPLKPRKPTLINGEFQERLLAKLTDELRGVAAKQNPFYSIRREPLVYTTRWPDPT